MKLHLLIVVFLAVATATLAQNTNCDFYPTPFYSDCKIDLTFIIDESVAMGNLDNVDALFRSLQNLATEYAYGGNVQLLLLTISANFTGAGYKTEYRDVCHTLEYFRQRAHVNEFLNASLAYSLVYYEYTLNYDPRNYQRVLVLLTAIDDETQINNALPTADTLRGKHGVQIITVTVGKSTSVYLPKLATEAFVSPTYELDGNLISKISNTSCINRGVTYPTCPPTPTAPYNPSPTPSSPYVNGGDGPLCAANHKKAWLDLIFVIEHSSATFSQWSAITASIMSTVSQLTLSNTLASGHTSRIAVITYDLTGTKLQFNFTAEQTTRNILVALNKAKPLPTLGGKADIAGGLKAAGDYLTANANFRAPGVVLYAATYDDSITNDPITAANGLKTNLIKIATVSCAKSNDVNSFKIDKLASPGLALSVHAPLSQLLWAVSQLNCRCARGWTQLAVGNVSYADCFFYEDASVLQAFALCENTDTDILALANTPARVDFIGQLVLKQSPIDIVSIGLSRTDSSVQWSWQNVYPYSGYPEFAQKVSDTDVYGYLSNSGNNNWELLADDGMTTGRFYVCQRRSGDTDNIVEL
uniref:VWFA domain-containing protein n=1 Tax=Panagrellus redivivus TaxID=6233 RepID=A0A7E4VJR3_PANRE